MKIQEFERLENKINNQNFHENYKTINNVMIALSYFGHIASIFLAFFMLSKVLFGVMDNKIIVYGSTLVVLSSIELLKRDIFGKFSRSYLKLRSFGKDVLPLFFLSITIIGISFYSSIKGASEYSSKSDKIEKDYIELNKKYEDSLTKVYNKEILPIENEIKNEIDSRKSKNDLLDKLNSKSANGERLSRDEKTTRIELNNGKIESDERVSYLKNEITSIEKERDDKVKKHHLESGKESKKKKDDNSSNSVTFIIFSTLIEISILAGVYFKDYYDVRSYREKKLQIEKDPNFQKWRVYKQILEILYTEETKVNQKLPSGKSIIDLCKTNDVIILNKDLVNFLKTMASLGIIKVSGSVRYINKTRELAFEILNKHFNIE
jgi:hypothetical protein